MKLIIYCNDFLYIVYLLNNRPWRGDMALGYGVGMWRGNITIIWHGSDHVIRGRERGVGIWRGGCEGGVGLTERRGEVAWRGGQVCAVR